MSDYSAVRRGKPLRRRSWWVVAAVAFVVTLAVIALVVWRMFATFSIDFTL